MTLRNDVLDQYEDKPAAASFGRSVPYSGLYVRQWNVLHVFL